ncbi:MAG: Na+/H+ antiporter subunit E [Acholeplasmataceae bacterium]|nr:Na+/H+ antiporter subunit E [Acholeplasmataceae bacterium]
MKYFATFIVLFVIYLFLTSFTLYEIILGGTVSAVLTVLLVKLVNYQIDILLPVKLVKFLFIYLPVFIWKLILANFDVAKRVLSPKIPLNPGIVKIQTDLKGDFGKLTLANSITLTPGTLSIDIIDDYIYVHAIDIKGHNAEENKTLISGPFEKILGGIFK